MPKRIAQKRYDYHGDFLQLNILLRKAFLDHLSLLAIIFLP